MLNQLKRLWSEEDGQGMVEYGLILALVSVVAIGALLLLGEGLEGIFGEVEESLEVPE
ncbi:Flp family type IVb pilin [Natranaerofaba carboxydovora]|uniref:Flp family type IVb pilin n=1 Tax=Natranaerofaba carboxydovora TaxID=2742683 RepID=UPI001F12E5BD|nr:Flp family type IVb pilin [Natranaerofaba carboxydovora]UMZ75039.1 Flp/Fap pilin component [Natranaerofaba carboxydovora]